MAGVINKSKHDKLREGKALISNNMLITVMRYSQTVTKFVSDA